MKKKSLIFIALTLVLSLFLAACSSNNSGTNSTNTGNNNNNNNNGGASEEDPVENSGPQTGGDLIIGGTGNPTLFNGLYSADTTSSAIEGFIFDGLLGSNTEFEPEYAMITNWDVSEDSLVHTLTLKEGLTFHDGEPLTAEDVKFTYDIPLHEDYDGPRKGYFESIDTIEVIDPLTVKITLAKVAPDFHITLSYGILPKHILGDVPVADLGEHEFNTKNPIGSGPFKFVEWVDGQYVKVEAFEDFHEGRPYLNTLTYKFITDADQLLTQVSTGDVQFSLIQAADLETAKAWEDQGQLKIASGLALSYTYLGYNLRNPLFQDKEVRQAITHALDRETIVSSVLNGDGEVAHFPESPLSWAYDDSSAPKFEYDPEKAKQMLADAGWVAGSDGILEKDGQKFEFELKTNQGNKAREDIAVVVQEQLKAIGIGVTPNLMEWSAFLADIDPPAWNFDAIILGWSLGVDPDPSGIFHTKEIENGLNFVGYSNPTADELMDKNMNTMDQDERKGYIVEVNNIIAEEQPYTFLYYPNVHRAMPTNLEGYEFHAKSDFYDIHKWWLSGE